MSLKMHEQPNDWRARAKFIEFISRVGAFFGLCFGSRVTLHFGLDFRKTNKPGKSPGTLPCLLLIIRIRIRMLLPHFPAFCLRQEISLPFTFCSRLSADKSSIFYVFLMFCSCFSRWKAALVVKITPEPLFNLLSLVLRRLNLKRAINHKCVFYSNHWRGFFHRPTSERFSLEKKASESNFVINRH